MHEGVDVLHVVPSYHPARGGIEVLVEDLVTSLHTDCGIDSAVVAPGLPGQRPDEYVHRGTRVHSIAVPGEVVALYESEAPQALSPRDSIKVMSGVFAGLRRVLDEAAPHLVHIHSVSIMAPGAAGLATANGIPVLFHEHSLADVNPTQYKRLLSDAAWVCAVSEAVAASIHRDCARTAPVRVIPNGIEDPSVPRTVEAFPSVVMMGRLSEEKGFDDGLRACSIVRRRYPDLRIRIVGSGGRGAELHALARRLNVLDAVDYFGTVDHGKAMAIMADSSVVLIPSLRTEGFSLVAAEAAFLGRPVVGTTVGGLPETVTDGETGLLVASGDVPQMAGAIERLVGDTQLRSTMGERARARALREFSVQRFARDVAAFYSDIWRETDEASRSTGDSGSQSNTALQDSGLVRED